MIGQVEWWDAKPHKQCGFIVVSVKVDNGYRLDRYYFRQSRIKFLAVEKIQKGQFVRFVPGPMPDQPGPGGKPMRPVAHDVEVFEDQAIASLVDQAASKTEACHE
jgi:hypothetical protein